MGLLKGLLAMDDAVVYRISANPRFRPDPSAVEEALKSQEAAAILGKDATIKVKGMGSFVDVTISGIKALSDDQLDALGKVVVSSASKKAPTNPQDH